MIVKLCIALAVLVNLLPWYLLCKKPKAKYSIVAVNEAGDLMQVWIPYVWVNRTKLPNYACKYTYNAAKDVLAVLQATKHASVGIYLKIIKNEQ